MPELPEVETMRRGILGAIGGTIVSVSRPKSKYRPLDMSPAWATFRRGISNRVIDNVRRLGKRVLVDLDSGHSIVFQPMMSGLLLVGDPPTKQHVRLRLVIEGSSIGEILYWDSRGLGSIHLWSKEEITLKLGPDFLGPDALQISFAEFKERFQECKREVKPTLLDQKRVAGVGNLYASEILHLARIHPAIRCCELTSHQWKRIYQSMRKILLHAIEAEGSTLGDGTYRNSLNAPGSYQIQHRVYDHADELCSTCKLASIVRIVQSQRSTFYCPSCQPLVQ